MADDRHDDRLRIGRRIQELRAERGLTQRALAEPAYTAAYVSTLESGKVRPSDTALRYLAERLGVSADQLATGRPAHFATDLRLRLADARQTLCTGESADAAAHFTELAAEAGRYELADEQAAALLGLGDCALEIGELDEAIGHFRAAEDLLRDAPLPRRVPALRGRAVAHLLAGDVRYSCYLLESTIDRLNAGGLPDPQALLLLYSAVIAPYLDLGAHRRAVQAAELALALAAQVDDPIAVARLHRSVARTMLADGRAAEADASLARAQELYQQLRIRTELAHCHWMRGYLRAQDGDLPAAERELRTARAMLTDRHAALYTQQIDVELADVLRRSGRGDEAAALLSDLLGSLHPKRGAVHAGAAHRLLGRIAEERGAVADAEEHYRTALELLQHAGATADLADLCRLLGDLLRRTGRAEEALDVYRSGLGHRATPGTTTLGPAPAAPPLGSNASI
ncbi:DNA-binding protein [Streptomyces rubellomurinus subsp. indigoferus]|uniref:DNA-binding protein n=1 Tax=Streptomyces rubellomurinus (strain ATCC 31215) TaxID=359131 RepID=A0A0F2TEY2_STRR3|nr:helix-turn-helix transcriptional regulator [Streptomyces rubellomurinus]KJS52410.1 DNA-binding protein [Streptomyces rubellomurinus subsp. indigoferus]KJS61694.1 DNA-binding protein [Streptomyces rubellomurinus]